MSARSLEAVVTETGETRLKVNSFEFRGQLLLGGEQEPMRGLVLWSCSRHQCTAKFYTDQQHRLVDSRLNDFNHNHLLDRTALVKRYVFDEMEKQAAANGLTGEDRDLLTQHAFRYLSQAFGSTLTEEEILAVREAVLKHVERMGKPGFVRVQRQEHRPSKRSRRGSEKREDEELSLSSEDETPSPEAAPTCGASAGGGHQLDYSGEQLEQADSTSGPAEDDDSKFFQNLLPMFRLLRPTDKVMIKAQIHQLINWKLKNIL